MNIIKEIKLELEELLAKKKEGTLTQKHIDEFVDFINHQLFPDL